MNGGIVEDRPDAVDHDGNRKGDRRGTPPTAEGGHGKHARWEQPCEGEPKLRSCKAFALTRGGGGVIARDEVGPKRGEDREQCRKDQDDDADPRRRDASFITRRAALTLPVSSVNSRSAGTLGVDRRSRTATRFVA